MGQMYFAGDLRSAILPVPDGPAPAVVWSLLAGDSRPTVVYLLTPAIWALLRRQCGQLEDRWARGEYPPERMEQVWERWKKIDEWACANLDLVKAKPGRMPAPLTLCWSPYLSENLEAATPCPPTPWPSSAGDPRARTLSTLATGNAAGA